LRDQQRPNLDANHQIIAVERDILDVPRVRRRWKAPGANAFHLTQCRKLTPALTAVFADVQVSRKRADTNHIAILKLACAGRPEIEVVDPFIDPLPRYSRINAARDSDPVGRRIEGAIGGLCDRADRTAAQGMTDDVPLLALPPEKSQTVDGAYAYPICGLLRQTNIGATVRK
jgi:hypothetical protein